MEKTSKIKGPSGSYNSPRWSGELIDCSVPVTFDVYNKCSYNCLYCFSFFQKVHCLGGTSQANTSRTRQYQRDVPLVTVRYRTVENVFRGGPSQFQPYILDKKVIQWGGLADPFDQNEARQGEGLRYLELLAELDYPVTFSTKGVFWTRDERYRRFFLGRKNWHVKFSIINLDPGLASKIEKGVPAPSERLAAMKEFAEMGAGWPVLRLRPFIIGMSDRRGELESLIRSAALSGARSVSTEFMCIESRADERIKARYRAMSEALGYDVFDFYRSNTRPASGYLRLNWRLKAPIVERMKRACEREGLRLYVSDAHFKELSPNCACCGLPEEANVYRGNFSQALQIAKARGEVHWSEIEAEAARYIGSVDFNQSNGYNKGTCVMRVRKLGHSLLDIVKSYWNNPRSRRSPYLLFGGVLVPDRVDERGDVVYRYNPSREFAK